MRRKSQPTRGAQPIAAASHGAIGPAPGSTGSSGADVGPPPAVVGPLALAVGRAADESVATPFGLARVLDRVERRRRIKRGAFAGAHARAQAEATHVTPPATPVYLVPDTVEVDSGRADRLARSAKRAVDVVGAVVGLALAAPPLAVLAVLVQLDSPGPALFAQARVGRGGRVFRCYKLRTMRRDAESLLRTDAELRARYERNGFKIPCEADHRVTALGRVLRLTSCDELPQLWNVLKGEMSLVGPRPLVARELGHYMGADRDLLLSVRPGLTGAWAVGGRSRVGYPRRAVMELDYVRHWSLARDVRILLRTVGAVLARRGAA